MKRSLFVLGFILLTLSAALYWVDSALGHLESCPAQSNFSWYNEKGQVIVAYNGDLNGCKEYARPIGTTPASLLPRTDSSDRSYRWF